MSEQARDSPVDRVRRPLGGRGMGSYIVDGEQEAFVENQIDYRHSVVQAHKRADADDETLEICPWCFCEIDIDPQPHRPDCEGIGKPRTTPLGPTTLQLAKTPAPEVAPSPSSATSAGGSTVTWTEEKIIEAIQFWASEYGSPPKADDWTKKRAGYPTQSSVVNRFGSWSAGIRAAGFEPRKRGGNRHAGAARSERESKAREAVIELPASPPDDLHVVGDAVRDEPGDVEVGTSDVVSRSEDAALDVRTITDTDWAALVDAEAIRCLAEADRLTARAAALETIGGGLRALKETDA